MDADLEEEGMEFVGDTLILKQMDVYSDVSANKRTKSLREVHRFQFIYRNNPFICVLNVFHYGANMSFICASAVQE